MKQIISKIYKKTGIPLAMLVMGVATIATFSAHTRAADTVSGPALDYCVAHTVIGVGNQDDRHHCVSILQRMINNRKLNTGRGSKLTVDGIFGAKTKAAVREYQGAHGLKKDGVVGPKTWNVLNRDIDAVQS